MKKNLLYTALALCLGIAFTACGSDSDDEPKAPVLTPDTHEIYAMDLTVEDSSPVINIILTKPGKAFYKNLASLPTRASGDTEYSEGTYTYKDYTYFINDSEGNGVCSFKLPSDDEAVFTIPGQGTVRRKVKISKLRYSDEKSQALCHNWTVVAARLRHYDGVTAVKQFDNPTEASNLNAILDYAKTKASIDEDFEPGMTIKNIVFSEGGKFIIFFQNGNSYAGDWSWATITEGKLKYQWENYQTMHNEFEDGTAVFDVRTFRKQNYYALTLGSTIKPKNGNSYKVELTFYLEQAK